MKLFALSLEMAQNADRRTRLGIAATVAIIVVLAVFTVWANSSISLLKKKRAVRESELAEMMVLKQRYQTASSGAQKLANLMAASRPDDSPAKVLEEIGIKGKGSQIKQVKGEERSGFVEDAAEVKIDGISANEMVNLLFRLEKGSRPVLVKRALVKARFDDPARLDLTLTVALLKQAAQGQK